MYHENPVPSPVPETCTAAEPQTVQAAESNEHELVIESRFGTLVVPTDNAVNFPNGLLGFEEFHNYALAELADPRYPQFKVLQCLDNHKLSFLALPFDPDCGILDAADIAAACHKLSFSADLLVILLLVTIRKGREGEVQVSANLRAPLLIDTSSRTGVQFVLPNENYPVCYPI